MRPRRRVRLYAEAERAIGRLPRVLRTLTRGALLGILSPEDYAALDELYYGRCIHRYVKEDHLFGGLFPWEGDVVDRFFPDSGSVLVLAAGGGRELVAFDELGYDVTAFESHEGLRAAGTAAMRARGRDLALHPAPRDSCPALDRRFDALVLGWGAFGSIHPRAARVALLTQMRSLAVQGAPLLVSFVAYRRRDRALRCGWLLASGLRRVRGACAVEPGDALVGTYVHLFEEQEVRDEFSAAGLRVQHYSTADYGHVVARA